MQSTLNVGNAANGGLIPLPRLNPREIAVMLLPTANGQTVKVMDASDTQFQTFVQSAGITVEDNGIAEWTFDDRCRLINHVLRHGGSLPFVNENNSETIPVAELFVVPDTSQEARPAGAKGE